MRAGQFVPQGDLHTINPRESLGEETDVPADALRHDIEVPARLGCCRIDVLSQIDECRLEAVEPPIHAGGVLVQPVEASVDLVEALIDLIEALVDLIEALVDLIEALVDLVEARSTCRAPARTPRLRSTPSMRPSTCCCKVSNAA